MNLFRVFIYPLFLFSLSIWQTAAAQTRTQLEVFFGGAYCFPVPLSIHQSGYEEIHLHARYQTRSLQQPIYYLLRLAREEEWRGWEISFIHLKIYLDRPSSLVQEFSVSHGFNILTVDRRYRYRRLRMRVGGGIVVAHPENRVRNRRLDEHRGIFHAGYYLSGVTGLFGISVRQPVRKRVSLLFGLESTLSWARVPVALGKASVSVAAVHILVGLGFTL